MIYAEEKVDTGGEIEERGKREGRVVKEKGRGRRKGRFTAGTEGEP